MREPGDGNDSRACDVSHTYRCHERDAPFSNIRLQPDPKQPANSECSGDRAIYMFSSAFAWQKGYLHFKVSLTEVIIIDY